MDNTLRIGKRSIVPKKAKSKKGIQGIFLTQKEWNTILTELKLKNKKSSSFNDAMAALEEVDLYISGKKKLRHAKEALSEL